MLKQDSPPENEPGGQQIHLLTDLDSTRVNVAALQQQLAERSAAIRSLNRQVEALTAQVAAATTRIADLDSELAWTREELAHRDNEISSLQKSVDLSMAENSRLSKRLADSEGAVGKAYVQLEQMKAALIVTERERAKTATAVDRANQKRQTETSSLNARLETMASCAATADKLLAGMRQNLREKLELLQNLLQVKDHQLDELKQSRAKLIERTSKLLEAFKARDSMLSAAEERNRLLTARLAQVEANAAMTRKSLTAQREQSEAALKKSEGELKGVRSELQMERKKRRIAEAAHDEARADCVGLQRKLDDLGTAHCDVSMPLTPRSTDMLLAETVSF